MQNQSIRDPLTGLFNRRYLEVSLERELKRAERSQTHLGAIVLDIDRFKDFNDSWGHEAGDLVLRELGRFLQANLRASDIACRFGGEEFALILPGTAPEDARRRAEQLRQGLQRIDLHRPTCKLEKVTASFGVACFPDHAQTWKGLLRKADAALYRAKAAGRDRVEMAEE